MLRVVVDTNVIVSGIISKKGAPAQVLDGWMDGKFALLISEAIIAEVVRVLSEPRLKKTFNITAERIACLAEALRGESIVVPGEADVSGSVPADPSDEKFLSAALDGDADVIISGDKDLLDIKIFRKIGIVTPRQFLERMENQG
jgi:putative PIN family toxin of toxin-antitoxin system